MAGKNKRILVLFDVDGTLTVARKQATAEMYQLLKDLRERVVIGFVGGSDLKKQKEQLGEDVLDKFDYCFPQNGVFGFKDGKQFAEKSFREYLGEENLQTLINGLLTYLCKLKLPVKRGTFIEYRQGMLNVSPIGRACSRAERNDYEKFDLANDVRKKFVAQMEKDYGEKFGIKFSIGGQISFDVFPKGWDKTLCLSYFEEKQFDEIHFFGDKTFEGGNDREIFLDERTIGHAVKAPEDTMRICKELFFKDAAPPAPPAAAPSAKGPTTLAHVLDAAAKQNVKLDTVAVAYTLGYAAASGLTA